MKKLISTDELNLELWKTDLYSDLKWSKSLAHTRFLTQPLKLEMFVPCDDKGNVLEEPNVMAKEFDSGTSDISDDSGAEKYIISCDQYQQALKKVLFKGFEYIKETKTHWLFKGHGIYKKGTIQDLVGIVELTENCKI